MTLMKSKKTYISLLIGLLFGVVVTLFAQSYTTQYYVHLWNSLIDATPIGQVVAAPVSATNLVAATANVSGNLNTYSFSVQGTAPSNHTLCGNGAYYVDSAKCSGSVNPVINDVTSSRSFSGTYTNINSDGNQMIVHVTAYHPGSYSQGFGISCSVNGTFIAASQVHNDQGQTTVSCEVPYGQSYSVYIDNSYVSNPQTPTVSHWIEELY